jgi:two-component system nitrogen regulation response regulator NtrX
MISGILQDEGFEVITAPDGEAALKLVGEEGPDLVLLDIALPGLDGLEVLQELKRLYPFLPVVMISAYGSVENAVKATRLGAYDFIEKPPNADKIIVSVRNGLELARLSEENRRLRQQAAPVREIIGKSEPIRKLREALNLVAPTNASVLITGENGTGKELVARALHAYSRRSSRPFVEVNCAAIPEDLIESELFGHEKGAFTGATDRHRGKFDLAHEGTLFLDEIADMSLKTQAKILRILEEQRFERVGGHRPIQVDVRIVAATNKNLEEEIARGTFREDLYHRIHVIPLIVPSLRERRENDTPPKTFSPQALELLAAQPWPGNVRELKNFVWRLAILTAGPTIEVADLPLSAQGLTPEESGEGEFIDPFLQVPSFREARALFEKQFLRRKLEECRGNVSLLAEKIGLERSHLYRKLKSYGLEPKKDG